MELLWWLIAFGLVGSVQPFVSDMIIILAAAPKKISVGGTPPDESRWRCFSHAWNSGMDISARNDSPARNGDRSARRDPNARRSIPIVSRLLIGPVVGETGGELVGGQTPVCGEPRHLGTVLGDLVGIIPLQLGLFSRHALDERFHVFLQYDGCRQRF